MWVSEWQIEKSKQLQNKGEYMNMIPIWGMSAIKWWVN
jgi:hypothetical protein